MLEGSGAVYISNTQELYRYFSYVSKFIITGRSIAGGGIEEIPRQSNRLCRLSI